MLRPGLLRIRKRMRSERATHMCDDHVQHKCESHMCVSFMQHTYVERHKCASHMWRDSNVRHTCGTDMCNTNVRQTCLTHICDTPQMCVTHARHTCDATQMCDTHVWRTEVRVTGATHMCDATHMWDASASHPADHVVAGCLPYATQATWKLRKNIWKKKKKKGKKNWVYFLVRKVKVINNLGYFLNKAGKIFIRI